MNSNENWELKVDPAFHKALKKFPTRDASRIIAVFENHDFSPYSGDIEKIKGETDIWRRRIGAYRIFYEINQVKRLVPLFHVERRKSKTY